MTREQALVELVELTKSDDTDMAHRNADYVLCKLLHELGYNDVVDLYHTIEKWYA